MGVFKKTPGRPSNETIRKRRILYLILIILVISLVFLSAYYLNSISNKKQDNIITKSDNKKSEYKLSGNNLEDFDLYFLKVQNEETNKVYSPLSIKFALEMLNEGASGNSKVQLSKVLGEYKERKYTNSNNMSLANAMFVKNSYKEKINQTYTDNLKEKYNADLIYDSFESAKNINSWISKKTLNLINNFYGDKDLEKYDYALVNALAIDMNWVNRIQGHYKDYEDQGGYYGVSYKHEKFGQFVDAFDTRGFQNLKFNEEKDVNSVEIGAAINKYDIVKELGEENIRNTITTEYKKWLNTDEASNCDNVVKDVNKYVDTYIKELDSNYKKYSSSTDFLFYDDDDVKVFAKDLKEYNETTLQYVGIIPKNKSLNKYIKTVNASNINSIIKGLKPIELDSFSEGVITEIKGYIPLFEYEDSFVLTNALKNIGITDIFTLNKANLSKMTKDENAYISDITHKANISFSNDGIKASAVTTAGGLGDASCGFIYDYEVPVKVIDLTFDKPFIYIIRDKKTGEVWFTGSVYNPIEYGKNMN